MEIGSDFELNIVNLKETGDNIFQYLKEYQVVYTDSGRSAAYILNNLLKPGIALLPSYVCESVIQVYENDFEVQFYKIKRDFSIDWEDFEKKLNHNVAVVYLMHYFGRLQTKDILLQILQTKEKYGFTIIEDSTHSIFTKVRTIGDYCICSLRKWFPIPDGGVLYTSKGLEEIHLKHISVYPPSRKLDAMILKKWYIADKVNSNSLYRKIFTEEEEKLNQQKQVYQISDIAKILLKYYSVSELIEKRKNNYIQVAEALKKNHIKMVFEDTESETVASKENISDGMKFVPFTCPIYINNRDLFRKYLIEHQVYCAVHWPMAEAEHSLGEEAVSISEHILSLPIDQRYGKEHMNYLVNVIEQYVQ